MILVLAVSIYPAQQKPGDAPSKLYPFSFNYRDGYTLLMLFDTPRGYERFPDREMSKYQAWLTNLPVWPDYYYISRWSHYDTLGVGEVAAIIDLGVKTRNQTDVNIPLQLLWTARRVFNEIDKIEYALSPKDTISYERWLGGKFVFNGAGGLVYKEGQKREHSARDYFRFIEFVMGNNGGRQLVQNCRKVDFDDIEPGDLYVQFKEDDPDSTGHAAMILDICTNKSGEKLILTAWGGNPAHSFFIPKSPRPGFGPWLTLDEFTERLAEFGPGRFYILARE
jgi:hypothetical protein